jgi:2-iminoacetate synthase ThiH
MSRILVLMSEPETPERVSIVQSDGLTAKEAQIMCLTAAQHFGGLVLEEEVERRLAEREEDNDVKSG